MNCKSAINGAIKAPIVATAIPRAVAIDLTGVGNNSAATRKVAEQYIYK